MLKELKPILFILLRFLGIYFILLFLYERIYLAHYKGCGLDPISRFMAQHVDYLQNFLGYKTYLVDNISASGVYYCSDKKILSIMVEGCNIISVAILFLAFIFAFYQGKKTFLFSLFGLFLMYVMNIFRIAGLNILGIVSPRYFIPAHDFIFPAIIYGTIVILWIVWINFFTLRNEKKNH